MLPLAASILGLMPAAAPQAVSFSAGLLTASAGPLLRRLRVAGVSHLAAVQLDPDACDALLDGGELDVLLGLTPRGEPDALSPEIQAALVCKDWVHVCSTVSELAGAKRVGGRTIWLNAEAYAEEQRASQLSYEDWEKGMDAFEDVEASCADAPHSAVVASRPPRADVSPPACLGT